MVTMATGGWTHVLTELSPLDALEGPLRRSARLRYTCVSVSKRYIALGSNTGGVYVFGRDTLKHLQVVYGDVESSALSAASISPNDVFVAYATSGGQVVVMEMNIEKRLKPERVRLTSDHIGNTVTCLHWDGASTKLFIGDNLGKISVAHIPSSKAKTLFIQPSEVILRLDMKVVQLDWWGDKLLVSTMSRSYLLNTNKQQYSQIGKKLRDGEYGACFFLEPSSQYPVVYCSRPGSRVWEVDFDANVLNTHQFKQLLAIPPLPIIKFNNVSVEFADPEESFQAQSVGFNKLCRLGPYLITWAGKRIYVFDPVRVRIILWNEQRTDVQDMVTSGTEIYIFLEDQSLSRLHLLPVERCLQLLLAKQVWSVAGQLLCYLDNFVAVPFIQRHISHSTLSDLVLKLKSEELSNLADKVQGMLDEMSSLSDSTETESLNGDVVDGKPSILDNAFKLPSGIFVVNNGNKRTLDSELYQDFTDFKFDAKDMSNQGETMLRYNSVDQLDSNPQYSNTQTKKGIRKSFSTTALDSMNHVVDSEPFQVDSNSTEHLSNTESENGISSKVTEVKAEVKDTNEETSLERSQEFSDVSLGSDGQTNDSDTINGGLSVDEIKNDPQPNTNYDGREKIEELQPLEASGEDQVPVIVEPVGVTRKFGKKKRVTTVDFSTTGSSTSDVKVNKGQIRRSVSMGSLKKSSKKRELKSVPSISFPIQEEDTEHKLYTQMDKEPDTISIDTLSSLASEEEVNQSGEVTPDTLSLGDGDNLSYQSNHSRSRTPIFSTDEDVPTLLQRLSASGVSADDSPKDGSPLSQNSLAHSVESGGSPQQNSPKLTLLAVKDSLQSKFSSKTKSFIQTIRKKSPLGKPITENPFDAALPGTEEEPQTTTPGKTETDTNTTNTNLPLSDPLSIMTCTVDLTDLQSITTLTRRKLQDMSVLLNPAAFRTVLLDWVVQLHATLQKLHLQVDQDRKVKIVGKTSRRRQLSGKGKKVMDGFEKESVNDLGSLEDSGVGNEVQICAEDGQDSENGEILANFNSGDKEDIRVRHPSGDQIDEIGKKDKIGLNFVDVENNNELSHGIEECDLEPIHWGDIFHFRDPFNLSSKIHGHVEELCAVCFDVGCHGNISKFVSPISVASQDGSKTNITTGSERPILEAGSCGSCLMCDSYCESCDHQMALFVRSYFHFFSVDQLSRVLRRWKDNWFHTWETAVRASQALGEGDPISEKMTERDYAGAIDLLRSFILPNKQAFLGHVVRLFAVSPHRAIEFVAEIPKKFTIQDLINTCRLHKSNTATCLSKYVHLRLGEMPSYLRLQIVKELCTKQYLTLTLLDSFLTNTSDQSDKEDSTGQLEPSPGSHMMKRTNQDLIDYVLDLCSDHILEAALQTCKDNRYWKGCLQLWKKNETSSWQQIISLVVKLGDISLLDESCSYGYLPKTPEEWHFLLHEFSKTMTTMPKPQSDWTNTLTWESVSELMMRTIGPQTAVMMLQDQQISEGELNPHFYQTCILESLLQAQQRLVIHNMLEKVDTYLWAQKQPHLAPQLLYAVTAEKKGRIEQDHQSYQELFSRLSMNTTSVGRSVEDAETHWGTDADVTGSCMNCSLPLTETVSHIVPGVLIFTCGHSFHKFCVPVKVCPLCMCEVQLTDQHHLT